MPLSAIPSMLRVVAATDHGASSTETALRVVGASKILKIKCVRIHQLAGFDL
jgi:hypothetical protein